MSAWPAGVVPADGTLLREHGRPEVWVMTGGSRLHIPSAYAFSALGHDWSQVHVVPDGTLSHLPARGWPTSSPTPGSVVFTPAREPTFPHARVWHPLPVRGTRSHVAWGDDVATIDLRGWLTRVGSGCNPDDPDWPYDLRLDVGWALAQGIDVAALVRVGNILQFGAHDSVSTPRASIAEPVIHLEVSGWPIRAFPDRLQPPDWQTFGIACERDVRAVLWPFRPTQPPGAAEPLTVGQYVRVAGSVVTDQPHRDSPAFAHVRPGVELWFTSRQNAADNLARWTEIHPPDLIEVRTDDPGPYEVVRGVAVAAPGTFTWRPRPTSKLDAEILAPPRPSPSAALRVQELVGAESDLGTILDGNTARTGARLTISSDRVRVEVTVGGRKALFGGSAGRFKAIYRLFWDDPPPESEECRRIRQDVSAVSRRIDDLREQRDLLDPLDPVDEQEYRDLQQQISSAEEQRRALRQRAAELDCS